MPEENGPLVLNALLRCCRDDDEASGVFESIETVPGLWVLELGSPNPKSWNRWLSKTQRILTLNKRLLKSLRDGSVDYTLHLTIEYTRADQPATIPWEFSQILSSCGIGIEIYRAD